MGGVYRLLAMGLLVAWTLTGAVAARDAAPTAVASAAASPEAAGHRSAAGALWADTAGLLTSTADGSRTVLLGRRDPNGPSCFPAAGEPPLLRHPDGGVGTRTVALLVDATADRGSAREDFLWHQQTLAPYCADLLGRNRAAYARALRLADQADRLAAVLSEASAFPPALRPAGLNENRTYLGHTARRLDEAIAEGDLAESRRRARAFRGAAARLADLHRWVDLLVRNEQSALAFQKQCRSLYLASDRRYDLDRQVADQTVACFPAAQNTVCLLYNLQAVEYQAEWLFAAPQPTGAADAAANVASAVAVPPHLRGAFVRLRDHLSADNRRLWDAAAEAPYHRSYLANVLQRYQDAGVLDAAGVVLERFNRVQAAPTVAALLDVLFHRGGAPSGTRSPAERFDARLMRVSDTLAGTREQVLLGAQHYTRAVFGTWKNYEGDLSLVEALDAGGLDCISASNLIGSIYRNAGRGGLYAVRWCGGTAGHSLVAGRIARPGKWVLGIVDGLDRPQTRLDLWPEAYVGGHDWPKGYTGPRPPLYAVEVYGRGLDNYVWCRGLIVRGEHAGALVRSRLPYLPAWTPAAYAHRCGEEGARPQEVYPTALAQPGFGG